MGDKSSIDKAQEAIEEANKTSGFEKADKLINSVIPALEEIRRELNTDRHTVAPPKKSE